LVIDEYKIWNRFLYFFYILDVWNKERKDVKEGANMLNEKQTSMCRVPVRALRPNPIINSLLSKVVKARASAGITTDTDIASFDDLSLSSSSSSSPTTSNVSLWVECDSCHKRTEYEVHYHCAGCNGGNYDICRDCYTRGIRCATEEGEPSMVNYHEREPFEGGWQMRKWSRETGEVQVSLLEKIYYFIFLVSLDS